MQGTRVGQYEFQRILGRGAFGEVWLAHDHRLGRPVAIKRLKPEVVGDPDARRRFDLEAETLLQVNEPHVVRVLDRIEIEGAPALVTDYMEGGSLSDLKKDHSGAFAIDDVWRWLEQAALGLAAIHKRGILHRDIKPANLFLSRDGNLSIGDFGLARPADKTQTLGLQGTMPYMSPEQIRGIEVDARSDLFSLGIAVYELLTGERPFGDGLDRSERPASARSIRPDVPVVLSDAIDALLETDVERRTQSAEELLAGLRGQTRGRHLPIPGNRTLATVLPILLLTILTLTRCWIPGLPWCSTGDCSMDAPADRRVAMLPFGYRGDPDLERLAIEVPTLVAARMDGVAGISAPAPEAFADCPIDPSLFGQESAEIDAWMEDHHTRLIVHGVITELSGGLRIDLSFHYQGPRGTVGDKASITLQDVSQALPAVNEVGLIVLQELLVEVQDTLARESLASRPSLEAFCAFLKGHQALRKATFRPDDLLQAVALDSTLAMAHYDLAWLAGWNSEGAERVFAHLERARRNSARLGPYGLALLASAEEEAAGNLNAAETILAETVTRQLNPSWAWLRLAYLHYFHNTARGRSWTESRREFERVLQLDPGNVLPRIFLNFIYSADGDDEAMRGFLGDPPAPGSARVISALTFGSTADQDSVFAQNDFCGQGFHYNNLYILLYPDNHRIIARFLESHLCDETLPADRAWVALVMAHVNAGMGRWSEGRPWFDELPASFRPWRLEYEALALSLPFIHPDETGIRTMIETLERWRPLEDPFIVDPQQFGAVADRFNAHLTLHEHLRLYCVAAMYARLGEASSARSALRRLQSLPAADEYLDFISDLVVTGEARIAFHNGEFADSLTQLQRVRQVNYESGTYSAFFQRADARYLKAVCLLELGHYEESLGWFEAADQNREFLLIYSGFAHLGQADAYVKLDRPEKAAEHYRTFLELFADSDPVYASDVARAREQLRLLESSG